MDILIRKKFFLSLIIILVLLNILNLLMIWTSPSNQTRQIPPRGADGGKRDVMDFIHSELALDSTQQIQIAELRNSHFLERRTADKFILDLRREIIKETIKPNPDTVVMRKYAKQVGRKHEELELLIYNHFNHIKSVLRKDQVEIFDQLMYEMIEKNPPPHQGKFDAGPIDGNEQGREFEETNEGRSFRPPPPREGQHLPPPDGGRRKPPPKRNNGGESAPQMKS